MKSLKALITESVSILSALRTATVTGTAVALANYRSNKITFYPAALTDGVHTPSITEADTVGGSYTAVAAADLDGTLGVLVANTPQQVAYIGTKPFIKMVITTTGSPSTGLSCAGSVSLGNAHKVP